MIVVLQLGQKRFGQKYKIHQAKIALNCSKNFGVHGYVHHL